MWDHNGQGPVEAVQFGPTGPVTDDGDEGDDCPLELKVGSATVVAREKCLQKVEGANKYKTTGDVRVNGIDLYTTSAGAGSAKSAAAATITIDRGAKTLMTEGKVEAKVGNVVLGRAQVKWKIPQDGGQILDLAGNPAVFETGDVQGRVPGPARVRSDEPEDQVGRERRDPGPPGAPEAVRWHGRAGRDHRRHRVAREHRPGPEALEPQDSRQERRARGSPPSRSSSSIPSAIRRGCTGRANLPPPVIQSALETEFQLLGGEFDYGRAKLTFPSQCIPVATAVCT